MSDQIQGQGAGRSKKRSPPHILADEHFNPPAAEQHNFSAGGGRDKVLKPHLKMVMTDTLNQQKQRNLCQ